MYAATCLLGFTHIAIEAFPGWVSLYCFLVIPCFFRLLPSARGSGKTRVAESRSLAFVEELAGSCARV